MTALTLHVSHKDPVGHLYSYDTSKVAVPGNEEATRLELRAQVSAVKGLRIAEARTKFGPFMEYCFFDETTREPYRQQWFHDEWADAWSEFDRVIIVAPRDHGKTSQIVGRVIWELGRNPNLRIKIACAADGRAKERLFEIIQHIQYNKRIQEVFPELKQDNDAEWSKHKIVVKRTAMHRDASVEALGITATATGGRCDLLIADDVVDRRNALSFPKLREQIKQAWKSDWTNLLEPESRVWYICTLWHKDDLSHELMENEAFETLFYAVDQGFGALWPDKWPSDALRKRHAEIGSIEFNRGFRNKAVDDTTAVVQESWIQYKDLAADPGFIERLPYMQIITSYDTARATHASSDYSANCTIAVDLDKQTVYVLNAWHAHLTVKKQSEQVRKEYLLYKPYRILIEKIGQAVLDEWVLNDYPDMKSVIEVTTPKVSKHQRLLAVTPLMEAGRVIFNSTMDPNGDT